MPLMDYPPFPPCGVQVSDTRNSFGFPHGAQYENQDGQVMLLSAVVYTECLQLSLLFAQLSKDLSP